MHLSCSKRILLLLIQLFRTMEEGKNYITLYFFPYVLQSSRCIFQIACYIRFNINSFRRKFLYNILVKSFYLITSPYYLYDITIINSQLMPRSDVFHFEFRKTNLKIGFIFKQMRKRSLSSIKLKWENMCITVLLYYSFGCCVQYNEYLQVFFCMPINFIGKHHLRNLE